jgi:rhamnose utilization protein RhaD (predicted bifunctional aldolase and dehydrogenase)
MKPPHELLWMAQAVGAPINDLCVLAEGNVSCKDGDSLWVKASGRSLHSCSEDVFVHVHIEPVMKALVHEFADEAEVRRTLNGARVTHQGSNVPSTETFMHAALLSEFGARFVAHAHPTALLSVLSLASAEEYAERRLFPDEVVFCGPATCFVPYVAPGIHLARELAARARSFIETWGFPPKVYWLQNHGLIAVGQTAKETWAGVEMGAKAARVLLAALQTHEAIRWLSKEEIQTIANWPDEHYRQNLIRGD